MYYVFVLSQTLTDVRHVVFFFQAEDGIRDYKVTGVQTCALPIYRALTEGVSGIFYSIQAASRTHHSEEEYAEFGEPHDRRFLESIRDRSKLTIIHCHGDQLMFERLARLPGHAWNWDDRATPPSVRDGQARVPGAVLGGLNQGKHLRDGTPEQSVAEVDDAIAQTGGR